jgi:hypothetical protein
MPIKRQQSHLLDIWHLNKAHWLTLFGVKVGEVRKKNGELVEFDLYRFGRVNQVVIRQDSSKTTVNTGNFELEFVIEPLDEKSHYLHVNFFSNHKALIVLWPLIQLIFLLTVIEDYIYYKK